MPEDKHEKAIDLAEQALDAAEEGDEQEAKKLAEKAQKLDPSAVAEVLHELDEAEHTSVEADEK